MKNMKRWWLRVEFDEELKQTHRPHLRLLIIATVLCIAYADHTLGAEFGFSIFYLLPVMLATRNLGRNNGFFISVLCAFLGATMDYVHGVRYSNPIASHWHTGIRLALFFITVLIFEGWEKEKENARTDSLTLIANRLAFTEFGQLEIKRSRRYNRPFSIIYIDVDNFKVINDKFGHKAGDKLLILLADSLKSNFRETDLVARLGGDEFAIILVETDAKGAHTALTRVCEHLDKIPKMGSIVTLSIGLLTYLHAPDSFDETVKRADELMYLAKNKGKNCIQSAVVSSPSEAGSAKA